MPPITNHYIMTIARCSNQFRAERLRKHGLCGQHCAYLLRICREPGTTQDAIAREIYVNKSNVTRQLATLEQNGFVERRPCEADSRAMEVYPTQKAMDVLPEVRAVLREWNDYVTAGFTEEEKAMFHDLLSRAAGRARQCIDEMKKEG